MNDPEIQTESQFAASIDAAAAAIGVHRRTLQSWLAEGAPAKTEKGYDIEALEEWRALSRRGPSDACDDDSGVSEWKVRKLIADTREAEAKARLKEHEAEKTTEDVVHMEVVEQFLSMMFTEFKRQVLRVPPQMGPMFPEEFREQMEGHLAEKLDILLRSMHGYCMRVTDLRED